MRIMKEVTKILNELEEGDSSSSDRLLLLVYEELRVLASARLANEKPGQTLQATALVHEAYLRLVGNNEKWNGRGHFFGAAAEAMRRIMVERARRKAGPRQGGHRQRIALEEVLDLADLKSREVLAVNEALAALEDESPEKAGLVKLRYFAGMSHQEAAAALGLSRSKADRHWSYSKAFLYAYILDGENPEKAANK